jgi:hypothetical protein
VSNPLVSSRNKFFIKFLEFEVNKGLHSDREETAVLPSDRRRYQNPSFCQYKNKVVKIISWVIQMGSPFEAGARERRTSADRGV